MMIQSGAFALASSGQVSVVLCRVLANCDANRPFTDTFTESGRSQPRNPLQFNKLKLEPTVRIELTTRALRKRCSTD
jgi:hypothetical protein